MQSAPEEQLALNETVPGSIPGGRTKSRRRLDFVQPKKEAHEGSSLLDRVSTIQEQTALLEDIGMMEEAFDQLLYAQTIAEQENDGRVLAYIDSELDRLDAQMKNLST